MKNLTEKIEVAEVLGAKDITLDQAVMAGVKLAFGDPRDAEQVHGWAASVSLDGDAVVETLLGCYGVAATSGSAGR